jgi:dihydroorotase
MSNSFLIKDATLINEGQTVNSDLLVKNGRIELIAPNIKSDSNIKEIVASGMFLIPGIIDDQVHFREPGLTHKAEIATESRAAVAGGITSYMEMPNTKPPAVTIELLEQKYSRASQVSPANYSFFMGTTNDNYEELLRVDSSKVCGMKIFMGSSTGNMLVDNHTILEKIFQNVDLLIATHCEDEYTVKTNEQIFKDKYSNGGSASLHPLIRSHEACYLSSSFAVELAKKYNTRLHVLHISTGIETALFDNSIALTEKRITSEACVHHLTFCDEDYESLGNKIKCNPAIKSAEDRSTIWKALKEGRIDIIATDHAPHTFEEKSTSYFDAPAGLPLVQHSLNMMYQHVLDGMLTMEELVKWMCHAPSECFKIEERGFIREGYHADLVLFDPNSDWTVSSDNILYKCKWSPLEGKTMRGKVRATWVNGRLAFDGEKVLNVIGDRLRFKP